MSHNFVPGDVVRIGKGKVEYTVFEVQSASEGSVTVQSNNTGKVQDVEVSRLSMVKANNVIEAPVVLTLEQILELASAHEFVVVLNGNRLEGFKSFDSAAFYQSRQTFDTAEIVNVSEGRVVTRRTNA